MKVFKGDVKIEFTEKKSKFIGYAKGVTTRVEAKEFVDKIKKEHSSASHNVSAFQILENGQEYYIADDDGEPSGTAGKPIGEFIKMQGIYNVVVVVTRYFGGVKLGAGGLIRNYAKAGKLAIEAGEIIPYIAYDSYILDFSYDKVSEVENIMNTYNLEVEEKSYLDRVNFRGKFTLESIEKLKGIIGLVAVKLD